MYTVSREIYLVLSVAITTKAWHDHGIFWGIIAIGILFLVFFSCELAIVYRFLYKTTFIRKTRMYHE